MGHAGSRVKAKKMYLGDSVYVSVDEAGGIILTTENGLPDDPSNSIYLEPEVYTALVDYIINLRKQSV